MRPADWIFHAKIVAHSWDGLRTRQIAEALGCHPQTVRERLQAFNDRGFEGLGMKPGGGRKPRLTERERSTILYLVQLPPPGKPTYELTGELEVPDPKGRAGVDAGCVDRDGPQERHPGGPQPGAAHLPAGRGAVAPHALVGEQ